jgi:hypothetical protein
LRGGGFKRTARGELVDEAIHAQAASNSHQLSGTHAHKDFPDLARSVDRYIHRSIPYVRTTRHGGDKTGLMPINRPTLWQVTP